MFSLIETVPANGIQIIHAVNPSYDTVATYRDEIIFNPNTTVQEIAIVDHNGSVLSCFVRDESKPHTNAWIRS